MPPFTVDGRKHGPYSVWQRKYGQRKEQSSKRKVFRFRKGNGVYYKKQWICHFDTGLLKRILGIAVPNGVEQGIFSLSRWF